MGSLLRGLKKFLGNKNTVTIIAVLLGVVVLYLGYNWRVKQATNPTSVPYAKAQIQSNSLIQSSMVGMMDIPQSIVTSSPNMIRNKNDVINKYVNYGTTIPANSFFYTENISDSDKRIDNVYEKLGDGETLFSLPVDINTTYGNSILPDRAIDLYLRYTDESNRIVFGKFIEKINVLDVRDSKGQSVFETYAEARTPSALLFGVPSTSEGNTASLYQLLTIALKLSNVEIVPVPRNTTYQTTEGETQIVATQLKAYLEAHSNIITE